MEAPLEPVKVNAAARCNTCKLIRTLRDGLCDACTHPFTHPHPDKIHVVCSVGQFILGCKKRHGTARSQVHYRDLIQTYLTAKRQVA